MTHVEEAIGEMQATAKRIDTEVRAMPAELLTWKPAPNVWTVMENLAHIEEFVPYWTAQIRQMIANPAEEWGRNQAHAGRLAAVAAVDSRTLEEVLEGIRRVVADCTAQLSAYDDAAMATQAPSRNPNWGVQPASYVLDHLLAQHIVSHCGQIQRNAAQFGSRGAV